MPALRKASATFCCCALSASPGDAEPAESRVPCGSAAIGVLARVRAANLFKPLSKELEDPAPKELAPEENESELLTDSENLAIGSGDDKENLRAET